jgi:hypothetical protein
MRLGSIAPGAKDRPHDFLVVALRRARKRTQPTLFSGRLPPFCFGEMAWAAIAALPAFRAVALRLGSGALTRLSQLTKKDE